MEAAAYTEWSSGVFHNFHRFLMTTKLRYKCLCLYEWLWTLHSYE